MSTDSKTAEVKIEELDRDIETLETRKRQRAKEYAEAEEQLQALKHKRRSHPLICAKQTRAMVMRLVYDTDRPTTEFLADEIVKRLKPMRYHEYDYSRRDEDQEITALQYQWDEKVYTAEKKGEEPWEMSSPRMDLACLKDYVALWEEAKTSDGKIVVVDKLALTKHACLLPVFLFAATGTSPHKEEEVGEGSDSE